MSCDCSTVEDANGNAEIICHRCGRQFIGKVCTACVGTGRAALDPVTEWQAESGLAPVAAVQAMLAQDCKACDGFGALAAPPATTSESHIPSPTPCAGCLPADGDYGDGPPPMVLGRHVEGCNGTATTERKET